MRSACMSRRFTHWLLALCLAVSPLFSGWSGALAAAVPGHEHLAISGTRYTAQGHDHCGGHAAHQAGDAVSVHCLDSCTASCHGPCGTGCGQCVGLFEPVALNPIVPYQPILTPLVTRLLSSDILAPRERPPRDLHA